MAGADAANVAWIDVLPSMAKFLPLLRAGTVGAAGTVGREAGAAFGASMADAVDAAAGKVAAAQKRAADAAGQLTLAEARLNEVRASGTASAAKRVAAEEAVAKAENNLTLQIGGVERAMASQIRIQDAAAASTGALASKHGALAGGMGTVAGKAGILSTAIGGVNKVYGLMFAAMTLSLPVIPIALAIKSAGDFQQSLVRLVTTAGESQRNLGLVGDGMLAMAGKVGIGANDLAKGMYIVESAGYHGARALEVLRASAQGARQEQADLGVVANAVSTILHDYHLPASQAADVTSQLVTAVSRGKTTFEELTASLHSITPLASALHIPLSDIAGSLAAMTASGESADQATENMRNALMSLQQPNSVQISQLAQLGISTDQLATSLSSRGLAGTMQDISRAIIERMGPSGKILLDALNQNINAGRDMRQMLDNMPPSLAKLSQGLLDGSINITKYRKDVRDMGGQAGAMGLQFLSLYQQGDGFNQILKSGKPVVQTYEQALQRAVGTTAGLTVALQLTGQNAAKTNDTINAIAKSSAQADGNIKGWSEVQGTFNQKLAEAKASIETMGIKLGTALLPALTATLGWLVSTGLPALERFGGAIADAWHGIDDFVHHNSLLVGTIASFLGGFLAAIAAFKTFALVITAVVKTVEFFKLAWLALNLVFEVSPIGAIITLVAGLTAGVIYLWNHSKGFHDFFVNAWTDIKNVVGSVVSWVVDHWKLLVLAIPGIGPVILGLIELVMHFGDIWHAVVGGLVAAWQAVLGGLQAVWHAMVAAWDAAGGAFAAIWHGMVTAWNAVGDAISAVWRDAIKPVWDAISLGARTLAAVVFTVVVTPWILWWKLVGAVVGAAWAVIHAVFDQIGAGATWLWEHAFKPALDGIVGGWNGMVTGVKAGWDTLSGWLTTGVNAFVAFWVAAWTKVSGFVTQVWNEIYAVVSTAISKVFAYVSQVWDQIWAITSTVWNKISAFISQIWDQIYAVISNAISKVFGFVSQIWDQLFSFTSQIWTAIRDFLSGIWNEIYAVTSNALQKISDFFVKIWNAIFAFGQQIWNNISNFFSGAWSTFSGAWSAFWDSVGQKFHDVWQGISDFASKVWNEIKAIMVAPINFVINTVLNGGLFKAWNAVNDFLHLPWHIANLQPIALAGGGVVPGFSPNDEADNIPAKLTAGEFVVRKKIAQRTKNFLSALNAGQAEAVQAAGGWDARPGFAAGGNVPHALDVANSLVGTPYVWGGISPSGVDCSGFQSVITNALLGASNPFHRLGTTSTFPWPGFSSGFGAPYAIGDVKGAAGIGHMAGTLDGHNVESGSGHGARVDSNALGATSSMFNIHGFLSSLTGAHATDAAGAGGHAQISILGKIIAGIGDILGMLTDSITAPIAALKSGFDTASKWTQIMAALPVAMLDKVWDFVKGAVGSALGNLLSAAVGGDTLETGTGRVQDDVKQVAAGRGWSTGAEWAAIDYIVSHESGWNPKAQNGTSSASGLFQEIDSTWAGTRPATAAGFAHAKDASNADQAKAGFNYIGQRYGDPVAAQAFWAAHHYYDQGGVWQTGTWGFNASGRDERVLSPPQDNYFRRFVDNTAGSQDGSQTPVWHFYLGDREITDLVDAQLEWRDNAMGRNVRSAR